jgi:CheY-like chemotaxis protein
MSDPTLLVVDDNPDTLQLFGTYLSLSGFQVKVAASAVEALRLVSSGGFDAIATDLAMPGIDGAEFIRQLRDPRHRHRGPIVAVSGQASDTMRAKIRALGCCRVFTKPCDLAELATTIRALVDTCAHGCHGCATPPDGFGGHVAG